MIMYALSMLLGTIVFSAAPVKTACECGYSWTIPTISGISGGSGTVTYTGYDVLETDWFHVQNFIDDTDWKSQNYNISASAARGPFG
jgi:hypothetical protein